MNRVKLVNRVVRSVREHGHPCPCHGAVPGSLGYALHHGTQIASPVNLPQGLTEESSSKILKWKSNVANRTKTVSIPSARSLYQTFSSTKPLGDYAFEMATSNIRFGFGATREVGYDLLDLGAKNVLVIADPNLKEIHDKTKDNRDGRSPLTTVLESLNRVGINYKVFSDVLIEPTDGSFKQAIQFASSSSPAFDAFVAVGGGSTIDTAKAVNLYSTFPPQHFLDYVNPPIGKGLPPPGPVKPFIAIPTTAGTGSETTGVAIFDFVEMKAKTGIANRKLKPLLGIVDPNNTRSMPANVAVASGFDVLCHSLESYTAIPFYDRTPRPTKPSERPAYQGSNPISDVWALHSLGLVAKYLPRAVEDPSDDEARSQVMLASALAGVGFGNAGVHLCHGMSYPVSGMVRKYKPEGYNTKKPIIPHGMSVVLHAPAVFRFTAITNPKRHLDAAAAMGADIAKAKPEDAGTILVDQVLKIMKRLKVPNGLKEVGFTRDDIPALVKGTLPQHRVTKLAPRPVGEEELAELFEDSMEVYK